MMTNENAVTLPEYARNPFIAKLPSLKTQKAMYKDLLAEPLFDERECGYPPHLRKHCIARLAKCFLPQARQVELADRFALLLRQGYLGRDPLTHDYLRHLHNGIERMGSTPLTRTLQLSPMMGQEECHAAEKALQRGVQA